jgi:hypothetical protein
MTKLAARVTLLECGVFAIAAAYACTSISDASDGVLSIQFDSLAAPAVVVGDSLRDTTGAVVLPVVHAFNFRGGEIAQPAVWFQSPDSGVTVDSASGTIVGDSLIASSARIVATVGKLQAVQRVDVTLRPDLIQAVNAEDSLKYSLADTTKDVSAELQVKLTHGVAPNDSVVKSWIVSFVIVYTPDPQLGELVNDASKPSSIDTTSTSGIAGRKFRLHPKFLNSATQVDSIVVNATAKYRGAPVNGSPVRLVLRLTPLS